MKKENFISLLYFSLFYLERNPSIFVLIFFFFLVQEFSGKRKKRTHNQTTFNDLEQRRCGWVGKEKRSISFAYLEISAKMKKNWY